MIFWVNIDHQKLFNDIEIDGKLQLILKCLLLIILMNIFTNKFTYFDFIIDNNLFEPLIHMAFLLISN